DELRHTGGGGADDGVNSLGEEVGNRGGVRLVVGVAGVSVGDLNLDAEVCFVDLLDGECNTGFLGRAEEREGTGLRKQGADLEGQVFTVSGFGRVGARG